MYVGKILSIIAGILTLIATFLFSWIAIDSGGVTYYANGFGIIKNLPDMFTDTENLEATLDIPAFTFFIIAGIFIVFLAAGVLQIFGLYHRAPVIIGTLVVLCITTLLFLGSLDVINREDWIVNILGTDEPLIEDIIPYQLLDLNQLDLGVFLLYAGGIVGLIAAIYGSSEF